MTARHAWIIVAFSLLLPASKTEEAWAGCWCHRGHCRHHCYTQGAPSQMYSAPPSQAPVQQTAAQQTAAQQTVMLAAPVFYYPVAVQTVQQTPAASPSSALDLRGLAEIIGIFREFREGICAGSGGATGGGAGGAFGAELGEVRAALTRLEDGQRDLRGRLINNAGISQSIGSAVAGISERLESTQAPVMATNDVLHQLQAINQSIQELRGGGQVQAGLAPVAAQVVGPGTLEAKVQSLQEKIDHNTTELGSLKLMMMEIRAKLDMPPPGGE